MGGELHDIKKYAPGLLNHTYWRLKTDIDMLEGNNKCFCGPLLHFSSLISACLREVQLLIQSFSTLCLGRPKNIWWEFHLQPIIPAPQYGSALHTTGESRSREHRNENGWTNGNDWQSQPTKNQALDSACCFSLHWVSNVSLLLHLLRKCSQAMSYNKQA